MTRIFNKERRTAPAAASWGLKVAKWAVLLLTLSACGAEDKPAPESPGDTSARSYAVSTAVSVGDDYVGYLTTVPSLDAGTTFDLDRAIEIEPSWIFGKPGAPYVYAASIFSPTITRYDLLADGSLVEGDTVSFANYGLESASLAASAPIYSDDKSYFIDDVQDQVVIWSPRLMQTIGTIPLGNHADGRLPAADEGSIVLHDGLLLTTTHYSDRNEDPTVFGTHVRLLAIDPKTDKIVESTIDSRLSYAAPQGRASDGAIYYSPASFAAAGTEIGEGHGVPPHALRVANGAGFDAAYDLDLSALVGGRPAGDFTLLDDQNALIRAWHSDLVDPITPNNWKDVLWNQAGFIWWRWRVGDAEATQVPDQTPGALAASVLSLDGKTYVVHTAGDAASTTLDEIDSNGNFHPGLTGPGQLIGNGVVRLR